MQSATTGGVWGYLGGSLTADPRVQLRALLAVALVVLVARAGGRLLARLGQPPVLGEMLGGLLLGPCVLGRLAPRVASFVLPEVIMPHLDVLGRVGVVTAMFLTGLELDLRVLRPVGRSAALVSLSGVVAPMALGAGVGLALHPVLAPAGVSKGVFVAFFSLAMSVTAFPVLARIVSERRLCKSSLGAMALACAACDDLITWCLLAVVVGVAGGDEGRWIGHLAVTLGYVGGILFVVAPVARRVVQRLDGSSGLSPRAGAGILLSLALVAIAGERAGGDAPFGAFVLGAALAPDGVVARGMSRELRGAVAGVLLPVFFAGLGLRADLGPIHGEQALAVCGVVVATAFLGKLGGVAAAARLSGMGWRSALSLGALMNARGVMELVVLDVGQKAGIVSPVLLTAMVVMTLVTTFAAGLLVRPMRSPAGGPADSTLPRLGREHRVQLGQPAG